MKTGTGELIQKLLDTHKVNASTLETFLQDVGEVASRHKALIEGVSQAMTNASLSPNSGFVTCPCCGSRTILSLGHCHLCGTKLFTEVSDEPKLPSNKKTEVKEKDAIPKQEVATSVVEDDGLSFLDEEAEEPKKEKEKKTTAKGGKKETTKASKPAETPKEEAKSDDDEDLSFLDDVEETDTKVKEEPKTAKKTESKKTETKKEEPKKESSDIDDLLDDDSLGDETTLDLDDFDLDLE